MIFPAAHHLAQADVFLERSRKAAALSRLPGLSPAARLALVHDARKALDNAQAILAELVDREDLKL